MSISVPMLVLSQICSQWRNIAISTASLWSSINVDLCSSGKGRGQPHALVELYIARSKSNPLSIWLRTRPCPSERTRVSSIPLNELFILRLLLGTHDRWQHVRLDLYAAYVLVPFGDADAQSHTPRFPLVENLDLLLTNFDSDEEPPSSHKDDGWLNVLVKEAPALHNLTFSGIDYPWITSMQFPYNQITSLHFDSRTAITLSSVFQLFTRLEHLSTADPGIVPTGSPFSARSDTLKSLVVIVYTWQATCTLLSGLHLPSLYSLELILEVRAVKGEKDMGHLTRALKTMLQQSSCVLRSFVTRLAFNCHELPQIIALMPSITDLSIHVVFDPPDCIEQFFSILTSSNKTEPGMLVLPLLKNLQVWIVAIPLTSNGYASPLPDPEYIITMVDSRRDLPLDNNNDGIITTRSPCLAELSSIAFRIFSERLGDSFCSILKERLQVHMKRGLTVIAREGY